MVTLKCAQGSRVLRVLARDEWDARQRALRRNAREGGPIMWAQDCRQTA